MMKRLCVGLAAAVAGFGAMGFAPEPSPLGPPPPSGAALPDGECILSHDIRNHSIVDQRTMLIEVFAKGVYRVTTRPACFRNTISADPITFHNVGKGRICKATDLGLIARGGVCAPDSIVKLSAAELAGLPRKLKP